MCYRCEVCRKKVGPRVPRQLHIISRSVPFTQFIADHPEPGIRQEIAVEVPVCGSCAAALREGVTLRVLRRQIRPPGPTQVPTLLLGYPVKHNRELVRPTGRLSSPASANRLTPALDTFIGIK